LIHHLKEEYLKRKEKRGDEEGSPLKNKKVPSVTSLREMVGRDICREKR